MCHSQDAFLYSTGFFPPVTTIFSLLNLDDPTLNYNMGVKNTIIDLAKGAGYRE